MRAVLQRVKRAQVSVDGSTVGSIDNGLVVLAGVADGDTLDDVATMAEKLIGLRVFPDEEGRMNRSVVDIAGSILVVSQFTLLGSVRKGRRPSFTAAASPEVAEELLQVLVDSLAEHVPVEAGCFGAHMAVDLVNDGPVTLVIDVVGGQVV
ncbi:MAG: D-tyrosyl-tRNA(Tyr) deacylase [Acidimicrobiia bacterium]|nr:D-tyrosyl-tRNA(Tyr) deacylase [Acidimicrobiia bacterium]